MHKYLNFISTIISNLNNDNNARTFRTVQNKTYLLKAILINFHSAYQLVYFSVCLFLLSLQHFFMICSDTPFPNTAKTLKESLSIVKKRRWFINEKTIKRSMNAYWQLLC